MVRPNARKAEADDTLGDAVSGSVGVCDPRAGVRNWRAGVRWIDASGPTLRSRRQRNPVPNQRQVEQAQREEGEAILALADAALSGKALPSDFSLQWQNDFVKAQRGTFVPFTLMVDASQFTRRTALVYVRAIRRSENHEPDSGGEKAGGETERGVDTPRRRGFPGRPDPHRGPSVASQPRVFPVTAGDYDVFVVMRERVDPAAQRTRPKASVLRQSLSVPDFGSAELTTSSVILADRLTVLAEEVPGRSASGAAVCNWAERDHAGGRSPVRAGRGLIVVSRV